MRTAIRSVLSVSLVWVATTVWAAVPRTYHIGNSLTDTLDTWLVAVAQGSGRAIHFHRTTIPGAPTDWIWDHPGGAFGERDYRTFLAETPIDHLFTQPFAGHNQSLENEAEHSLKFLELARKKNPKVRHWIYGQWPRRKLDDPWSKGTGAVAGLGLTPAPDWDAAVMNHLAYHEALAKQLEGLDGQRRNVVPAGLALLNLKRELRAPTFLDDHFADDIHLSDRGRYLVSLVVYAVVFGEKPADRTAFARAGLTADQAAVYQRVAWETVVRYKWAGIAR